MLIELYEVMESINNTFATDKQVIDSFTIEDGILDLPFVKNGQYVLIEDSAFNDGVYQYPLEDLEDESFLGIITVLSPPKTFLAVVEEIKQFRKENPMTSSAVSESFGGYSVTRATGLRGGVASWEDVFRSRLNKWRKI